MGGIPPEKFRPCGTPAAARRHQRHGEPLDADCQRAVLEASRARYGYQGRAAPEEKPDMRERRNGIPENHYYHGMTIADPRYEWARRAIREAEAKHGRPPADWEAA